MPNGIEILVTSASRRMAAALLCKHLLMRSDLLDLPSLPLVRGLLWIWPHRPHIVVDRWTFWMGARFESKGSRLEAESDPKLHNLKSDSAQVFVGPRKTFCFWKFLRKRQIARAEGSVKPVWIKPGSFSILTLTSMISFIKGLARLSFSQMIKVLQIPRNSFLFVFTAMFKKCFEKLRSMQWFWGTREQVECTAISFRFHHT